MVTRSLIILFFLILSLLTNHPVFGRDIDSLFKQLSEKKADNSIEGLDIKSILCNDIAVAYQELDDNNKARFYYMQAIDFSLQRIEKQGVWDAQNNYDMASLYQNLGVFESTTGNKQEAEKFIRKAEFYYRRLEPQLTSDEFVPIILSFYQSSFTQAYHASAFSDAENYMRDIRLLMRKHGLIETAELSRLEGELLIKQGRYEEALPKMEEALKLFDSIPQPREYQGYRIVQSYVSTLFYLERYVDLIEFMSARKNFESVAIAEKYALNEEVLEYESYVNTLFILSYALMDYGDENKDYSAFEEAFQWQKLGFRLAENYILNNLADRLEGSVSSAKNKVAALLNCSITLKSQNRFEEDEIFYLLRILDLYQSARLHLERISYTTNRETWERQKEVKAELDYVTLKLEEAVAANSDQGLRDSLRDRSYQLSLALNELQIKSKQDLILEEYHIGQAGFKTMVEQFKRINEATILTYFYEDGSDSLFIIGASPKGSILEAIAVPENLNKEIIELYRLNSQFLIDPLLIQRQEELNQLFYQRLIAPVLSQIKTNYLVIYPIGELGYISFDALQDPNKNYLVEKFSMAYTSSLFSIISEKKKPWSKIHFTAFYPTNYGTDSLAFLYNGKQEIEDINTLLKGELFEGDRATKTMFLESANKSSIIHIASHSLLAIENPYESSVLFDATQEKDDHELYAYEIFSKTISADLVILSSCNSAHGEIEEGIGTVSLANAFYFAGTPATISSLWSAQDLSSSAIMIAFYGYLKQGFKKSESLRRSKLEYLENSDKIKRQPFFWANYVVYGSDFPLFEREKGYKWYNYVIGLVLTFLLLIVGKRYFKSLKTS